ncbi:hypothetical protein [Variovorax sp. GT1P44]|uniref:hypothetical protein n=1 Tax=Variovorax sp. GT1P44 TaxID=3443742 RepID=UPI003F4886C4
MKTPAEVFDWLTNKVEGTPWSSVREHRKVTHEWKRHTGGRTMAAGLTASIAPSPTFSLSVDAAGVEGEYVTGAKDGVFTVLMSQSFTPVLACQIDLTALQVHPVDSSYAAFYMAAKEATERLLGVVPGFELNIAWGQWS